MASADDVKAQTGFTIGGVSPVGHINDLNIIIDKTLERFQIVYAAAGHPNSIFKIDISKLKDLTKEGLRILLNETAYYNRLFIISFFSSDLGLCFF